MKVVHYKPMRGKKGHECLFCQRFIPKGLLHYNVSLEDEASPYPVNKKSCYQCWKEGQLKRGVEVAA